MMARIRSRVVETESVNPRMLRRGSVVTSKIPNRAVREAQQWPGSQPVQQKQLAAGTVTELDGRFLVGETVTVSASGVTATGQVAWDGVVRGEGFGTVSPSPVAGRSGYYDFHVTVTSNDGPISNLTVTAAGGETVVGPTTEFCTSWRGVIPHVLAEPADTLSLTLGWTGSADVDVELTVGIVEPLTPMAPREAGIYAVSILPGTNQLVATRTTAAGTATLASETLATSAATWYLMRVKLAVGRIRVRVWADGDTEPSAWAIDVTDASPLAAGLAGVTCSTTSDTVGQRRYDTLSVTHGAAAAVSTDFSEYAVGGLPDDWTVVLGTNNSWGIVELVGSTGGKILRYPTSGSTGSFVAWETPGSSDSTEVLARIQTTDARDAVGVVLSATSLV